MSAQGWQQSSVVWLSPVGSAAEDMGNLGEYEDNPM
jgi:hypothetical protein